MSATPTHSFFPAEQKISEIERKIELIEVEIIHRKRNGYGSPTMLALWKSIATDYRTAMAQANVTSGNVSRETSIGKTK